MEPHEQEIARIMQNAAMDILYATKNNEPPKEELKFGIEFQEGKKYELVLREIK